MTEFERSLMALRDDHASFRDFMIETQAVWRRFARYLCRRWRPPLGVDEEDVVQELLLAGWQSVQKWDPERGTTIDQYVRFNALDKAKKWLHKQRNSKRRDGSAPARVPAAFSTFERADDEAGSAQDRLAWVGPEELDAALIAHDRRKELARLFAPVAGTLTYRERECITRLVAAAGSVEETADAIVADRALSLALRVGSDDEALALARRTITKALQLVETTGGIAECH